MEILFISAWFPFPHDTGSRLRVYHLLRALGQRHRVHLLAFLPSVNARQYLPAAEELCASVRVVKRDPFWRDPVKRFMGYFSILPRDVISGYSQEMAHLAQAKPSGGGQYDMVISFQLEPAPYSLLAPGGRHIMEIDNLMTRWMEERYWKEPNPILRAGHWVNVNKCRRYERRIFAQFDALTVVSGFDLQAVKALLPQYSGRLEVIPNGVDLETRSIGLAEPVPDTLVFNGALTYYANLEAMQFFIKEVWPIIRGKRPAARLQITGRTDGLDLSWLTGAAGVELTGYLEDVRPAVAGSWLAIAPLREGGGTRLKILEAMALGVPVVATSKGAEGLEVVAGKDILIADEPEALAAHCLRVLQDPGLRAELAVNARCLVEQRYGWQAIGEQFCRLVETL